MLFHLPRRLSAIVFNVELLFFPHAANSPNASNANLLESTLSHVTTLTKRSKNPKPFTEAADETNPQGGRLVSVPDSV
jgi:hypothetical protein